MALGAEPDGRNDDHRRQELENQSRAPVPIAETLAVLGACIIDPVGQEATDRKVHLPGKISAT